MKRKIIYGFMVLFLSLGVFLYTTTSAALVSETKTWQTTDSTGDPDIADPNPAKNVYIDSSYTGSPRNGTISQPYNSWAEVPKWYGSIPQNKTYLFKRGTTNYWPIEFLNKENINIWAYGVGTRPKIIYTWDSYAINVRFWANPILQQNSSTRIVWLEVVATKNADALVRFSSNTSVENCYLHNAWWWLRSTWDPIWSGSSIKNITLKGSVIEDIADDGMYIVSVSGVVIEDNLIRKVNQNYFLVWPSQQDASWDGIQFVRVANRVVRNNKIDRSDTPNKFWFIFGLDSSPVWSTALIEWNTFIAPRWSSQWGSTVYWAVASGANLLMQNNVFSWSVSLPGYNQTCIWYNGRNLTSRNNIYKNMNRCLTNKFFQNWVPQVPIYSQWDTFIWCNYNTEGNIIISWSPITNQAPSIANQLFAIFKNDPNGTFVWDVIASDPDNGQTLTYSIIWGNTNNAFSINSVGTIIVHDSSVLQNYTNPFYTLTVRVQDNGSPSLYTDAQIKVVIDSTPLIYTQIFSVNKYSTNGTVIGRVLAENPYNNSPLSFSILWWNTNTMFGISSTGMLYVSNASALANSTNTKHTLAIRVDWNGSLSPNSAWAWMTINVVNNYSPNIPPIPNNDPTITTGNTTDDDVSTDDVSTIDRQAPTTIIDKISSLGNTKFTVKFKATDNVKIKTTYYRVGYLSWKVWDWFTASYRTALLVRFFSIDSAGNREKIQRVQIIKKDGKFSFIER